MCVTRLNFFRFLVACPSFLAFLASNVEGRPIMTRSGDSKIRVRLSCLATAMILSTSIAWAEGAPPGKDDPVTPVLNRDRKRTGGQSGGQAQPQLVAERQGDIRETPGGGYKVVRPGDLTDTPSEPGRSNSVTDAQKARSAGMEHTFAEDAQKKRDQAKWTTKLFLFFGAGTLVLGFF